MTKIIADEGKIFRRKSDGFIFGGEISLGYDYYDANIGLSEPHLAKPEDFEEIDKPEDYEIKPIIDHVTRLKRAKELIERNTKEMNSLKLSAVDALEVKDWYPKWGEDEGFKEGDKVTKGTKFQFGGKLYAVLQDHAILAHYEPSINTASLYVEVTPDYKDLGSLESPIPYEGNMILENGKYYSQDDVVYRCFRDTVNPVYHALKDLVGLYVGLIE